MTLTQRLGAVFVAIMMAFAFVLAGAAGVAPGPLAAKSASADNVIPSGCAITHRTGKSADNRGIIVTRAYCTSTAGWVPIVHVYGGNRCNIKITFGSCINWISWPVSVRTPYDGTINSMTKSIRFGCLTIGSWQYKGREMVQFYRKSDSRIRRTFYPAPKASWFGTPWNC